MQKMKSRNKGVRPRKAGKGSQSRPKSSSEPIDCYPEAKRPNQALKI